MPVQVERRRSPLGHVSRVIRGLIAAGTAIVADPRVLQGGSNVQLFGHNNNRTLKCTCIITSGLYNAYFVELNHRNFPNIATAPQPCGLR